MTIKMYLWNTATGLPVLSYSLLKISPVPQWFHSRWLNPWLTTEPSDISFLHVCFSPPESQCSCAWDGDYKMDKGCKRLAPLTPIGKNKSPKIKTRLFWSRVCSKYLLTIETWLHTMKQSIDTNCPFRLSGSVSEMLVLGEPIDRLFVHFRPPADVILVKFSRSSILTDFPSPHHHLEIGQKGSRHLITPLQLIAKGRHLMSRVDVHNRNPVEPQLSVYLHCQAYLPTKFHNIVLCRCWLLTAGSHLDKQVFRNHACPWLVSRHFIRTNSSKQFYFFTNQFRDCFHTSPLPT